ncbi:RNA 2',3'-cyclic phosphodiesterase [Terribacillus saccharophilus]|uniref:RNA 2',3'-cyclic phosphodiesterase n=1 Tax=Terribacillus saccharophilus TaxID=361277 RepID=A0A268ABX1_9BACI|nr:RNA 2',3'-cyclic phosphodiesterase [Terribacillus saccharophilus]PAD21612.1 RNA 2',3'-cyclic phosphodiesterase [Terribacillus saccharophilus]PAF19948.1 RNA 2',3'-cyclic phosphodiesterase [Terribacillus saccharophilus]
MSAHYFIGIGTDDSIQAALAEWQNDLKAYVPMKLWPRPEEFHITLQFLGATTDEQLDRIKMAWQKQDFGKAFSLDVAGVDTFGSPKQPRVVWAGVKPHNQLQALHQQVTASTGQAGFKLENRPYRPHITLGKKWGSGKVEGQLPLLDKHLSAPILVEKVTLYRIEPGKRPKYVPVLIKDLEKE